jgi:hypothetical protein
VTAAANDAGGQGFVTEFAGDSAQLGDVVWSEGEEQTWQQLRTNQYQSFDDLFATLYNFYSSFDGFWDAFRASVSLPENVPFDDFQLCPSCYPDQIQFSPSGLFQAVDDNVIAPMRVVQELLERRPYVTRLYSTLSAADMTLDPVFTMNPDLAAVSNIHTADRIIECSSTVYQWEAPWRIELPQGSVIRGTAQDVGSWPSAVDSQPANLRVLALSSSGAGAELENNKSIIDEQLAAYNMQVASGVPMVERDMPMPMPGRPGAGAQPGSGIVNGTGSSGSGDGGCSIIRASGTPNAGRWCGIGLLVALAALLRRSPAGHLRS